MKIQLLKGGYRACLGLPTLAVGTEVPGRDDSVTDTWYDSSLGTGSGVPVWGPEGHVYDTLAEVPSEERKQAQK